MSRPPPAPTPAPAPRGRRADLPLPLPPSLRSYGFITPDAGGEDIFVHQTAIETDGFRSLAEGEAVEFVVQTSDDGRAKAVQVTGPGGAAPQGAPRQYNDGY